MIRVKDHKSRHLFTPFEHLGPKRLALLESSWAHLFREEILHRLPVHELFHLYDEFRGRKTKDLYTMLGIVLLQQMEDLTDEDAVDRFAFDIKWHYALNATDPADCHAYVSQRTIWTMRDHVGRLGLEKPMFENVTDTLSKLFALDPSRQRLDSVHIFSNMAHLGRIRLFVKTIRKFLVNLRRHHADLHGGIGDVAARYDEKGDGQFAVKPSESARKLQEVGDDCFYLVERFRENEAIASMSSYRLLVRLFNDQCVVEGEEKSARTVVVKPNKDVPSDSLQNPSDPDAGYCGHKGRGFKAQIRETWSPDKSQPNLLTHVAVEAAHESDANALLPAVSDPSERGLAPKELLADSLYGGDENVEKAAELGVEVISPAMGRQAGVVTLADFGFSGDEMTGCPQGHAPVETKTGKHGGKIVRFDGNACGECPIRPDCPARRDKRHSTVIYDLRALRLARRRAKEKTESFRGVYRFRAGIEGTMSDLDRMTGIKRLRVRGMPQVRLAATLKAAGLNILRATAFRNMLKRREKENIKANASPNGLANAVIESFRRLNARLNRLSASTHTPINRFGRMKAQIA